MASITTLLYEMDRQIPYWPTTFSQCENGCGNIARGGAACLDCVEKELKEKIGPLASEYRAISEKKRELYQRIINEDVSL